MFLYSKWFGLPINKRHKIAQAFNIQKKGSTEVFDNTIRNDGYLIKDIEEALTLEAMQKYLGSKEKNISKLFDKLISHEEKN